MDSRRLCEPGKIFFRGMAGKQVSPVRGSHVAGAAAVEMTILGGSKHDGGRESARDTNTEDACYQRVSERYGFYLEITSSAWSIGERECRVRPSKRLPGGRDARRRPQFKRRNSHDTSLCNSRQHPAESSDGRWPSGSNSRRFGTDESIDRNDPFRLLDRKPSPACRFLFCHTG